MTAVWDDPPRLSDEERAALLPFVSDEVTVDELEALARRYRAEQRARDLAVAAVGALIGSLATLIAIITWFVSGA